jgi:hypothetical protein
VRIRSKKQSIKLAVFPAKEHVGPKEVVTAEEISVIEKKPGTLYHDNRKDALTASQEPASPHPSQALRYSYKPL